LEEDMPDGIDRPADHFSYHFPAAPLGMSSPWLVGAAKWNAQICEGFGMLASEWQNFVSRRIAEDFAFMQRIVYCRTPDQVWGAHADFWQKAVEDYGKEYMLMGKLAASLTTKAASTAQSAAQEASTGVRSFSRAA
jgi:hypothetical protein